MWFSLCLVSQRPFFKQTTFQLLAQVGMINGDMVIMMMILGTMKRIFKLHLVDTKHSTGHFHHGRSIDSKIQHLVLNGEMKQNGRRSRRSS